MTVTEPLNLLERWAQRLELLLEKRRNLFLGAATLLCLITFTGYAHVKAPWMDECLEVTIARLPLPEIWSVLRAGVQVDPPMLHGILHYLFRIFGESFWLARTPAIVGFSLLCLCSSLIVWRHSSSLYGAAAFFLPYATFARTWGMDARPYALMLGFSALTLLLWDRINDKPRPGIGLRTAFTLSLAIALCCHFYSVFLLLALAAGELVKLALRRRLDWMIAISAAVALIPYALSTPIVVSSARVFMKHYFYRASFSNLYTFYGLMTATLPFAGLLIVLLLTLVFTGRRFQFAILDGLTDSVRALLAATGVFLLVPFMGYAAGALVTGFFVPYNHMMAVMGIILCVPLLAYLSGGSRAAGLCLLAVFGLHGLFLSARGISGLTRKEVAYPRLEGVRKLLPEPTADLVISSSVHFLPYYIQSRQEPPNSLLYLYDFEKPLEEFDNDTGDLVMARLRGHTEARVESFDEYVASHRRLYLAAMGAKGLREWHFNYLLKHMNARFRWLGRAGDFDLFQVDWEPSAAAPQSR